uniref:NADH dehydrogenase subunit 2 n=1 Tax=Megalobenedenia derzhavini TaxID=3068300 RepID=A0AA49KQN9_9PLAT|nr:NADH dehydrogenase subunit 2 [Megalobenedenia derzhavini]WLG31371.1 NADH dehydrogenase subunit 2 [Megalobenedenia derzhavini]
MNLINICSCGLSIFFSILVLFSNNLINLWLVLELSILSVVPCFFTVFLFGNYYSGLLYYLFISGISSGFMFSGFLFTNSGGLLISLVAFFLKFCLFPFGFWIYIIASNSSWLVIWLITCVGKVSSPILSFLFNETQHGVLIDLLCCLTLFFCSLYYWFGNSNLSLIWVNMSVASGTVVLYGFLVNCLAVYLLLAYYLFWGSLCITLFSIISSNNTKNTVNIVLLFFSIPLFLSFFYKILSVFVVLDLNSTLIFIILFFFYGISEQYYMFKYWGYLYSNSIYISI